MAPTATISPVDHDLIVKKLQIKSEPQAIKDSLEAICYGPYKLSVPRHPSFAAHRLWALNHTAAVFRYFARNGFNEGLSGHISLRDPEYPYLFWINPLAIHFAMINASDMLLLSDDTSAPELILAGNRRRRPANKAGWAIHSAIHRKHPHVNAACHAHTVAGKTWSATHSRLRMIDQDVCKFYGNALTLYNSYGGVVLGSAMNEGEAIATLLTHETKGCILANHGLLTVGHTVDEAGYLFGLLEKSCRIQLDLAASGKEIHEIGDQEARFNFEIESKSDFLYWEFQPEYDYEVKLAEGAFEDLDKDFSV